MEYSKQFIQYQKQTLINGVDKLNAISLRLKKWMWEDFLPCLLFGALLLAFYNPFFVILHLIWTCYLWKGSIFIWIAYYLWVWYDLPTVKTTGRKWHGYQYLRICKSIRDYFPLRLKKVADLPPDRNYLFVCFPHAIIPFGTVFGLTTNGAGRAELFPNIDVRLVTLNVNFSTPLGREYFMSIGGCTADRNNIIYLLQSKPSKALIIYPGGSRETFISCPGPEHRLIKKNRKGFIKVALQTGTPLVPIFSFGENNVYGVPGDTKNPLIHYLSRQVYERFSVRFPILKGRGIFTRSGFLPQRRPINIIVGRPLEVPKVENPSSELVDEYHEKFYQALTDLFEEHKAEYDEAGENAKLCFM